MNKSHPRTQAGIDSTARKQAHTLTNSMMWQIGNMNTRLSTHFILAWTIRDVPSTDKRLFSKLQHINTGEDFTKYTPLFIMFQQPEFFGVHIYGRCCNVLHNISPLTPGVTSTTHTKAHVHIHMVGGTFFFVIFIVFPAVIKYMYVHEKN